MIEKDMRQAVFSYLEGKGFDVEDISGGSGVPKMSRLRVTREGESLLYLVKKGAKGNGRIHFVREEEDSYKVLNDFDRVIWIYPDSNTHFEMLVFERSVILDAFQKTFAALKKAGKESYEIWLSPDFESGARFTGSGFRDKAIISEKISISSEPEGVSGNLKKQNTTTVSEILTKARQDISLATGLNEDSIHIELNISA